jgi:polysaccharide export outer membrane protein
MLAASLVSGCTSTTSSRWKLPEGQQAYAVIPDEAHAFRPPEYRISPRDKLTIAVFREPELSVQEAPVEPSGGLVLPLIGRVQAAGRTTSELSGDIARMLRDHYLVNPTVSVIVAESKAQNVTVDGAVTEAGVYELQGRTTLSQSIAMAKGATRVAQLDRVAVFRTIDGKRNGAVFDVEAIRAGEAPDLVLQSGDYVVVSASGSKALWYDILGVLPAFGLFVPLVN